MSLIDFIEKLQKKPKQARIQILYLAVFVSMMIIFSFWLISFKYSIKKATQETPLLPEEVSRPAQEMNFKKLPLMRNMEASLQGLFEKPNNQGESPFKLEESLQSSENINPLNLSKGVFLEKEIPAAKLPTTD